MFMAKQLALQSRQGQRSWLEAYKAFVFSRDENFMLKIAPLILLFGTPEILVSNIIPIVGEFADIGSLGVGAIVLLRTLAAVNKYRSL